MHPALSVLFFTTLSGTGYGLLFWIGLHATLVPPSLSRVLLVAVFAAGLALVSIGLLCSFGHLGKPMRAWRAFSQWRTSWLSREAVAAVFTYVPAVVLFALLWQGDSGIATRVAGGVLALSSVATVACTAMLYISLPPIAAWRNRWVMPVYLGFALLGGAWLLGALLAFGPAPSTPAALAASALVLVLGIALLVAKLRYWRETDAAPFAATAEDATGLGRFGRVKTFEAPHTEANYLLREMGFVLARKHATRLRRIALVLAFVLPPLALAFALLWPASAVAMLPVAVLAFQAGAFVERWLFFAQARHTVALYYRAGES